MTHDEAAKIYDASDASAKRYFGVIGILFAYCGIPELIKFIRGLINEKSN